MKTKSNKSDRSNNSSRKNPKNQLTNNRIKEEVGASGNQKFVYHVKYTRK